MRSPIEQSKIILDECRSRIQANMAKHYRTAMGDRVINATGKSSEAFKVVVDDTGLSVSLIYQGDDVAPIDSIQYGHKDRPSASDLKDWMRVKTGRDLTDAQAERMADRIASIGTERFREPQEWVITPELEKASDEIRKVLADDVKAWVHETLFR